MIVEEENTSARLSSVELFNMQDWKWTPLPEMLNKRSSRAAVAMGDQVLVFGGYNGKHDLDTGEVMDMSTEKWKTLLSTMSTRRAVLYAAALGDHILSSEESMARRPFPVWNSFISPVEHGSRYPIWAQPDVILPWLWLDSRPMFLEAWAPTPQKCSILKPIGGLPCHPCPRTNANALRLWPLATASLCLVTVSWIALIFRQGRGVAFRP
mmetsp:Transcript_25727/g.59753  ORF Transcript_25727/g.59753 Transcript_25727/m.59753 type:complete len:210 (+) Transcript_25727:3-632(+)